MSNLKARVNKLYTGTVSDVSSQIVVMKDDKCLKKVTHGTNKNKVIKIVVRL